MKHSWRDLKLSELSRWQMRKRYRELAVAKASAMQASDEISLSSENKQMLKYTCPWTLTPNPKP